MAVTKRSRATKKTAAKRRAPRKGARKVSAGKKGARAAKKRISGATTRRGESANVTKAWNIVRREFRAQFRTRGKRRGISAGRGRMSGAGEKELERIFKLTIGKFVKAKDKINDDIMSRVTFVNFLKGQVRRIAEKALDMSKGTPVSEKTFREAATVVMKKTNRTCKLAVKKGKMRPEGDACTDFLNTPRGTNVIASIR